MPVIIYTISYHKDVSGVSYEGSISAFTDRQVKKTRGAIEVELNFIIETGT
jgi:hypothetical protein